MYIVCIYTFTKNCSCASWKNDFPHDLICLLVLITDFSLLSMCVCVLSRFSCVWLFVILWTVAHQAPLSMSFSRQEYWSGLPCPPPGDLPHPGMEPMSLTSFALAGGFFTTSATWETSLLVRKVKVKSLSHVPLFATPWTVAYQVLLPMGFSRQEYWVGCYFLFQGLFVIKGLNPCLLHWQADSLPLSHQESPRHIIEGLLKYFAGNFKPDSETAFSLSHPLNFFYFCSGVPHSFNA